MGKGVCEETADLHPKITYQPKEKENQISLFRKFVEKRHGIELNDYWDLLEWSKKNYPEFWECVWLFFDVICSEPYSEVFDRNRGFDDMEWFKGAKLNFAENALRNRNSKIAFIATDDSDRTECITYEKLYNEVCIYAETLKAAGVQKGDVVACYMSNKVEAVYAYLATASMGNLFCAAQPLLGPKAVLSRFQQVSPKILFTAGNFSFEGKEIDMLHKIPTIVESLPSLEKVVFVPSLIRKDELSCPKCVPVEDFLKEARTKLEQTGYKVDFAQVPFDHPLCIDFTSGTTGLPKALIHSHGAFLAGLKDYGLHWDCTEEEVLFNYSTAGWVSWNMHLITLQFGLTQVMYDGLPFEETPTRFWDLVDKFGITSSFIWSSTVEAMELKNYVPTEKHSLKSLRQLFPMGSPCKPQSFEFMSQKLKPGLFCCPGYGTTEFFGMCSGLDSNLPVYKGELQCFTLGSDFRTVDDEGNYIIGKRGELVELNPCPTLPVGSLGKDPKKMIKEMYLSRYPGHWYMGDDTWINPVTGGFIVYGRSDETMNPKGARFNCSEIYFALIGFPGLVDSVCVSHYNSKMDERVVLFVKMASGLSLTPQVEADIRKTIEEILSYEHVPDLILEVPDIPYNVNGKKLNSLVKKLINKKPVANTEIAINPSSVEHFKNLELGDF